MHIPAESGSATLEIQKSRFISEFSLILSADEARARVKALWKEHPQARHIVWAFILGKSGELCGRSDDGEPSGTAGNPTLDVLKGADVTGALVTTIRYFGGIKLGTGGLVRAYTQAAQEAIAAGSLQKLEERNRAELTIPYALYDSFVNLISGTDCRRIAEDFAEAISVTLEYPAEIEESIRHQIKELTNGKVMLEGRRVPSPLDQS